MRAIGYYENLPIENEKSLIDLTVDMPVAVGRDIVVKVNSIGLNPADYMSRQFQPLQVSPTILGWDVAGVVEAVGDEVEFFNVGDEVFYSGDASRQGANSEYHAVDERIVGMKPKSLDFPEAAGIPLSGLAAYEAIFDRLKVSKNSEDNQGKTMLIVGSAGGVGTLAIQLAKSVGLTVVGTAVGEASIEIAKSFGVDATISHYEKFMPQLEAQGLSLFDYILSCSSTDKNWEGMADVIKPEGAICAIAPISEPVDLALIGFKSVTFSWEVMFTRAMFKTESMVQQHYALNELSRMVDAGELKTSVKHILKPINAANIREAHRLLETREADGKVVVTDFE